MSPVLAAGAGFLAFFVAGVAAGIYGHRGAVQARDLMRDVDRYHDGFAHGFEAGVKHAEDENRARD